MGVVRVLLAFAVVFQHTYGTQFDGGYMAVQLFFIVSGFVISFILIELNSYPTVFAFYKNRVLRLFPIYYLVALGSLVLYVIVPMAVGSTSPFQEVFRSIDANGLGLLIFSNLFIFTQDWIMFTAVHDGVFQFSTNVFESELSVWRGLLVPPAWSLGVELTFYLIAPFILPRMRLLFLLLGLSIAVRLYLINAGLTQNDQWNYRFFPSELAFFIVGALAHQLGVPLAQRSGLLTKTLSHVVTWAFIGFVLIFVTLDVAIPRLVTIVVFTAVLPFMFYFQKFNPWDRWIGELSYPIYLVHWPIMYVVNFGWDRISLTPGYQGMDETLFVALLSVVAALVLKKLVADRIEKTRDRVRQSALKL